MAKDEPAPPPAGTRVTLDRREPVAEGTWAFHFGLGNTLLPYRAGQAVDLTYPGATRPDPRGHVRPFTLAAAPGASRITIATRIRESPFKQELLEAPLGTELYVSEPWGDFVVPSDEKDVVMLAGGIGVTPFRAIVQDAVARSSKTELSLIHSARTPEETPFLDEFRRWAATHPHLAYLPTMTQAAKSPHPWLGERRRIDAPFLADVLDDALHAALYMVAGPPAFVKGVAGALAELGVPADRVKIDEFDGY
jgi:ferredoxin-NADP reductase